MSSIEDLFNAAELRILVPDQPVDLPADVRFDGDAWLDSLSSFGERRQAFFDERLHCFLRVDIHGGATSASPSSVPRTLVHLLAYLQITLDVSYIAATASDDAHAEDAGPASLRLSLPPRLRGAGRAKAARGNPSIFPPATPNPTPFAAKGDRRYAKAEGVNVQTILWGDQPMVDEASPFALFWSAKATSWVVFYRLEASISFVRAPIDDPLLCLTASTTLRDRPSPTTPSRKLITSLVEAVGGLPTSIEAVTAISPNGAEQDTSADAEMAGFEEVNLLEGLQSGLTAAGTVLELLSTRLGPSLRKETYALPPVPTPTSQAIKVSPTTRSVPTMRKSFRRTLATVTGFAVKMRSVHVPHMIIPGDVEDEQEREEIGSEERTVVLCTELENPGDSGVGFAVERVDVKVAGEGARIKLIAWGDQAFQDAESVFPLLIGPMEQITVLYAVSFLRPADAQDLTMSGPNGFDPPPDYDRQVSIAITGRPFERNVDKGDPIYPTQPFLTRWHCTINLHPSHNQDSRSMPHTPLTAHDALPTPASPFPTSTGQNKRTSGPYTPGPRLQSPTNFAGKRHTIGGALASAITPRASDYRSSMPSRHGMSSPRINTPPPINNKFMAPPPAIAVNLPSAPPSPLTTASIPDTPGPVFPPPARRTPSPMAPPMTPAYPAYSVDAPLPPTPHMQLPIGSAAGDGMLGPSIEPHRDRLAGLGLPLTPGPHLTSGAPGWLARPPAEPIVVSFALEDGSQRIHALDTFVLDVFVFNQSSGVRRFEISYPEPTRRRHDGMLRDPSLLPEEHSEKPGVLPVENRIRIGPLRPSTCQSVRFPFIALRPGVHAIAMLTLTDTETGFSMNLRSVMEIVVHESPAT